mgnify:CR=1 FL=1
MLTNEDYSPIGIKQVSTEAIKQEMEVLTVINLEAAEKGFQAEQEEKMGLAFAYAADMGVHRIKYAILEDQLQSREFADKFARCEVDIAALLGLFK